LVSAQPNTSLRGAHVHRSHAHAEAEVLGIA
jgi:hypothetical protein